jgi:hypothetical protein
MEQIVDALNGLIKLVYVEWPEAYSLADIARDAFWTAGLTKDERNALSALDPFAAKLLHKGNDESVE